MAISKIKFKKRWSDKAVSEIVGTILTLAITVVLFSSIMVFVMNMPMPTNKPVADFVVDLAYDSTTHRSTLTLVHNGGEKLFNSTTQIIVSNDAASKVYNEFEGGIKTPAPIPIWTIGITWTKDITNDFTPAVSASTQLTVTIIDTDSNSVVWSSRVGTGTGNSVPVIMQRWTDSDITTLTPDPIIEGDVGFSLFVRATDPDSALTLGSVTINASSFGGTYAPHLSGDTWEFRFTNSIVRAADFDGKPIVITASDGIHFTSETFILRASASERGPSGNPGAQGPQGPAGNENTLSESGLPKWLKFVNEDQGYVILPENKATRVNGTPWPGKADLNNESKTSFYLGEEWVFVRVGSLKMTNVNARNNLTLVNHLSGQVIANTNAFTVVPQTGNAFIFESKFNSSQFMTTFLSPGGYDLIIDLLSSGGSGSPVRFFAKTNISILPVGQPNFFIPSIETFNKNRSAYPANATVWGDLEHPYDLSSFDASIIWVEVHVLDAGLKQFVSITDVRITDMRGRTNLYGVPPSGSGMITAINSETSNHTYRFSIDLRLRNGVTWSAGRSAYSLTLTGVSDQNEGVYTMSAPIWISSAIQTRNYVIGTNGFGFGAAAGSFAHYDYLFQVENNKFFSSRVLEGKDLSPGSSQGAKIYKILYFDIDGDGDRDVVAAMSDYGVNKLVVYINRLDLVGIWEPKSLLPYNSADGQVMSMAYGDVNGDGINDWVVATESGKVYLYTNEFPVTQKLLTLGSIYYFSQMKLADVTGDGRADLLALGSPLSKVPGTATFKMYLWNLTKGSSVTTTPYTLPAPATANVYDFDVGFINSDSYPDIALVSSSVAKGAEWFARSSSAIAEVHAQTDPTMGSGNFSGLTLDTYSRDASYQVLSETTDAADRLNGTWQVGPIPAGSNPTLYIDAKAGASSGEGFYFYYSRTAAGPYTFMFTVPSSQVTNKTYSFHLPIDISGTIYVRVLDADLSSSSIHDSIYVNWLAVTGTSAISWSETILNAADNTYTCIGIGNVDSTNYADIILGKSGLIQVITTTATGTKLNEYNAVTYAGLLAGNSQYGLEFVQDLFEVKDVNGDGLADVVAIVNVLNNRPSLVAEWLNLGGSAMPQFTGITVLDVPSLYGAKCGADDSGNPDPQINCLAVENMYG